MKMALIAFSFFVSAAWATSPVIHKTDHIPDPKGDNTIVIETDEAGRPAIELEAAQPKKQKGSTRGQAPERTSSNIDSKNSPQVGVQLKLPLSKGKKSDK